MQHVSLLAFNKEKCKPFFDNLTDLFHQHHHSDVQNPDEYEKLLYTVKRPYDDEMLNMIDSWMNLEQRDWKEETTREVKLALYAIRYPDTLLIDSFTQKARSDIHPSTDVADPFIYGAYVSAIELLKDVAPFTCFLEHDVPRQRLFQAALAAYGRQD